MHSHILHTHTHSGLIRVNLLYSLYTPLRLRCKNEVYTCMCLSQHFLCVDVSSDSLIAKWKKQNKKTNGSVMLKELNLTFKGVSV